MTATRDGLPVGTSPAPGHGRYGHSAEVRADRNLKIIGAVLGAALLATVGWSGASYIAGQDVSGELIKYKVVSDEAVEVHLEVRKDADAEGVCTLRSLDRTKGEVGRKDVRFDQRRARVDDVVTVRTTDRATAVQLVGCQATTAG